MEVCILRSEPVAMDAEGGADLLVVGSSDNKSSAGLKDLIKRSEELLRIGHVLDDLRSDDTIDGVSLDGKFEDISD